MKSKALFAASVLLLTLGWGQAETIFDNTGYSINGGQLIQPQNSAGSGSYAQAFTTTAQSATITEIQFFLNTFVTPVSYSIDIYASTGAVPTGSVIANIFSGTTEFTNPHTVSGLSIALDPSTQYFISASVTSGSLLWYYTNAYSDLNAFNDGTGWVSSTAQPLQMKVTAVPEPSVCALFGGAIFGLVLLRLKRRAASHR